jgi:hypothetical protein
MSGMIHAWRGDMRTVTTTGRDADRRYGWRHVDWCKSCGDLPEALRLPTMPWSGGEDNGIRRRNFFVELIVAGLVSEELLTARQRGRHCAGPFVSRSLEA